MPRDPKVYLTESELTFEQHKEGVDTMGYISIEFRPTGACRFEVDSGMLLPTRDGRDDMPDDAEFTIDPEHVDDFFAALEELIQARQRARVAGVAG